MIPSLFNVNAIYEDNEDVLLFWQKKIFKALFIVIIFLGIIPYFLSFKYAFEASEWHNLFFYTLIYIWACGVAFFKKVSFHTRVKAGLLGFYFMGVFCLLSTGLIGSTRLYFLCFSAFAAIFSGIRGGVIALLLSGLTFLVAGVVHFKTIFPLGHVHGIQSLEEWIALAGTFSLLSAALTLSLAVLIKALEISGREFKHLVKNTPDIIWTLDRNFTITFINSTACSTFGFFQKEMLGKPITHFLNEKTTFFKEQLQHQNQVDYETFFRHKNDTPLPVEIKGSKISHFSDSPNMYQGIIRDISEKKRQDEEQQRLKNQLIEAEKHKAMGILAGSVAHDLNNILSGIATYPEVLMMDKTLDPQIKMGLTIIKDSGQKASAVVSDLLTISRGSRAQMEVININFIIDRYTAAPDFEKIKTQYPHVEIEILTEPELLNIKGSYIHIEKVIMNLVLNAVEEVSHRNNGRVRVTTANTYLDSALPGYDTMTRGEYVLLSVIDNGSGIDNKYLNKIFDPFFTKKKMGRSGTGLGLAVVWNAVQDHNGSINVTSKTGETRFDLMFPAVRQPIPQSVESRSINEIKGQGQRVLVVDDLKDQQKIALHILNNLGYKATAVDNGYAAVEHIKNNPTDLIILDMIMAPSISGLETFQMIKKINPGQKAIIASGYSESKDVLMAQDLGAGSFIKKPYTVLDMGIAVKEELVK